MNQLPTLIEYLLLSHDYVVISGLGTFMVQPMEASRRDDEELFLPPFRSVRFNAAPTPDDNLLANSIGELYATTSEQAGQLLCTWVSDFRQTVETCGVCEFGSMGVFVCEADGELHFQSHEAGVTSPAYYGLDAFHMAAVTPAPKAEVIPITASMETNEKQITIRLNRRLVNIAAAACAMLLLMVTFLSPTRLDPGQIRSTLKETLWPFPTSGETGKDAPIAATLGSANTAANAITPGTPSATEKASIPDTPTREYCIVLASAISHGNAERYVETLSKRGFLSARIVSNERMTRVVVGHYHTEEEAVAAAREIRSRSEEYRNAWVFRL